MKASSQQEFAGKYSWASEVAGYASKAHLIILEVFLQFALLITLCYFTQGKGVRWPADHLH